MERVKLDSYHLKKRGLMMKKTLCLLMIFALLFSLAACSGSASSDQTASSEGSNSASSAKGSSSVTDAALNQAKASSSPAEKDAADTPKTDGVDVDLTTMSSTMVYSEVLNMQKQPDQYIGKIVKMSGPFSVTEIEDKRYFACLIKDATACCSTGIEFDLAGDYTYPDDYPEKDSEITVIGSFTTYMEGNSKYLQLKDAKLLS
jgi:hypothetical protein